MQSGLSAPLKRVGQAGESSCWFSGWWERSGLATLRRLEGRAVGWVVLGVVVVVVPELKMKAVW